MTKKAELKEMLKKRTPLLETKREAVTPVNMYTKPQVDKTTSRQVGKQTKPQTVKPTKPQVVKYTTHLKPEVVKELKRYALENDLKDYEVMGEAVEMYLKAKETPQNAPSEPYEPIKTGNNRVRRGGNKNERT